METIGAADGNWNGRAWPALLPVNLAGEYIPAFSLSGQGKLIEGDDFIIHLWTKRLVNVRRAPIMIMFCVRTWFGLFTWFQSLRSIITGIRILPYG